MRKIFLVLALSLIVGFTGCPPKSPDAGKPGTSPTETPSAGSETKTVAASEPVTPEAKEAVELVQKLNGKFTLTSTGSVLSITVSSSNLDEAAFDLFVKQPDLETLFIANFRELNDAMVKKLVVLKKLKKLQLKNSSISDDAVKTVVEAFPGLVTLDISSNTRLTDAAIKEVVKLKNLENLIINYCNFSEFSMMDITTLPKLKSIDIRANAQIGNGGLGYLTGLPTLKALIHSNPAVDDTGLESLTAAKGLTSLEMQDFNISDRAGEFIKQFEKLTDLIIFRCPGVGSQGLLELKGMKLNRLTLRGLPSVDDAGMEVFRDLTTLKRLYLNELASVSDDGILNLVYLKDLDTLDIWDIPITDKSLETISKLTNLKTLKIRSTQVTDAVVDILLAMPKLESLTLKDNSQMTPAGLNKIRDSKKFKELDFGTAAAAEE